MVLIFFAGEARTGLLLIYFFGVSMYEYRDILAFGAIFLRAVSFTLFLRDISSLTNSLLLSIILLIFYICFFFISSWWTLLFSLSYRFASELIPFLWGRFDIGFKVIFFVGESPIEIIVGLILFGLGTWFSFVADFGKSLFSFSFKAPSYKLFNSKSLIILSSFMKNCRILPNLDLFFFKRIVIAKMNPLLYLPISVSIIGWRSFSTKLVLLVFFKVDACKMIWPRAMISSSFVISRRFLPK